MALKDELKTSQQTNNFGDNADLPTGQQNQTDGDGGGNPDPDKHAAELMAQRFFGDPSKTPEENAKLQQEQGANKQQTQQQEPAKKVVAKIGDKEFTSAEEAIEYANELHNARTSDEAYIEGLKAGQQQAGLQTNVTQEQQEQYVTDEEKKELEDLMYSDPAKYITRTAEINARIAKQINDKTKADNDKQAQIQEARNNWWNSLYQKFPDLAKDKDFTEGLMNKHIESFGKMDATKAIDSFGDFAMKKIREFTEKFVPSEVLSNQPAQTASVSTPTTQSKPQEETTQNVDFITQIKQQSKVSGIRGQ